MSNTVLRCSIVTIPIAFAGSMVFSGKALAAYSLVPQVEGEINVGLGTLPVVSGPGVSPIPSPYPNNTQPYFINTITSQVDTTTGTKSRLFVDHLATANTYGTGAGAVTFGITDAGTRPDGYWFRPSERQMNGTNEETGQLEVGTFDFNFNTSIPYLKIRYFDTESTGTTGIPNWIAGGILQTDGTLFLGSNPVPSGSNSNIYEQVWTNVSYVTLKLGQDTLATGDGVDFQLYAHPVPEPITLLGSGIAFGFGAHVKRKLAKRQKSSS